MNMQKRLSRLLGGLPPNPDLRLRALVLVSEYQWDMLCVVATSVQTADKLKALDHLRVGLWNRLVALVNEYEPTDDERGAMFGKGGCHAPS